MTRVRRIVRLLTALPSIVALSACGTARPAASRPRPKVGEVTFSSLAPDVYRPCGIATVQEAVWVLSCSGKVVRVRAHDRIARTIEGEVVGLDSLVGEGSRALLVIAAVGSGTSRRGVIVPLDAASGEMQPAIDLGSSIPMHAAVTGRTWIATIDGGLFTLEGDTTRRVASGPPLVWIATDGARVWTVAENGDVVERAENGAAIRTFSAVVPGAIAAAAGEGSVWLSAGDRVVRVDATNGRATRVDVSDTVNHIEHCNGSMWLSQPDFGLRSLDASGTVLRSIPLEVAPAYLACDATTLWILSEEGSLGSIDTTK
jgi:hypothetical protein